MSKFRSLIAIALAAFCLAPAARAADPTTIPAAPIILDMVHNNPGETPFTTRYNDPAVLKKMGYTGKVFFLFESAQLAVNWDSVDPTILPQGSPERAWVDKKAAELDTRYAAAKAAGLDVFCESDLIIFPKNLIEKEHLGDTFGDPADPQNQKYLRLLLDQMFTRFPQLDGIVVRIGETYLQDAPYHVGKITDKSNVTKTIIPLIQLLRDEVCVKLHKKVIFRTWLSFDKDLPKYMAVNDAVEPDPNLILSIKHCEGDFNLGNRWSRILGTGRHRFIVEVECQREYEGKGAYPDYITHDVIDGFDTDAHLQGVHSLQELRKNPLFSGVWTWTRGGGWEGPYITNELWCDLNAWVLVKWVQDPTATESEMFDRYCTEVLHLDDANRQKFRELALLSPHAVLEGKRSTDTTPADTISPFWTRDDKIGAPPLPKNKEAIPAFLSQKADSVHDWEKIVALAESIHFPDTPPTAPAGAADYVVTSSHYGLYLYRIYQAAFNLAALTPVGDKNEIQKWLAQNDQAWKDLEQLKATHPECASLYKQVAYANRPGLAAFLEKFREHPATAE